jgi:hypothetical protein
LNDLLFSTIVLALGVLAMTTVTSRFSDEERRLLWLSFAGHCVAALGMIVVVRNVFEGGDMLAYHRVGSTLAEQFRSSPSDTARMWLDLLLQKPDPLPIPGVLPGSSTGSMQAIAAVLALAFNDSLFASGLLIALGAFFAKASIFRIVRRELPELSPRAVAIPCLLLPSVVFWSSGILKEPVAIIGMGAVLSGAYALAQRDWRTRNLLLAILGGIAISLTKPHILPPLGAAATAWFVIRRQQASGKVATTRALLVGGGLALGVVLAIGVFFQRFAPDQLAEEVMRMQEVGAHTAGGSQYTLISNPNASLATQVALVPWALLTVLFRPALFEARTALVGLNAVEVTVLTWLFMVAVFRHRLLGLIPKIATSPTLAFCALFVLSFGVGVGLTTTNLGTLSRYRTPMVPFFGVLLMAFGSTRPNEQAARGGLPQQTTA